MALLMAPEHSGIQSNLALALGAGGRTQEALDVTRATQKKAPQDPSLARLAEHLERTQVEGAASPALAR